ncbi:MAG: glutamine--tRNA ligase/YqeY domain fusion protein [Spirochaetales bacterium]|nr:glutamine--tRNA ligase/YqeY domain fusion protein [Spirochaetales bacterium]
MSNQEDLNNEKLEEKANFIEKIIISDIEKNKNNGAVVTRFPPEPNGYLHIGHAKSICLNFGIAQKFSGKCNLRFDDTNPVKEDLEYIKSIEEDIKWLGFTWDGEARYASNYFQKMFDLAVELIKKGLAYVDDQTADEIRISRGTLTEKGKDSPFRERSIEENLELFLKMKNGEFENGEKVLRAKIDMGSPNINLRDPIIYRISHETHHNTGDQWCLYPMYDWAHGLEDSFEGITHSICTLEFEDHRPLYDWFLNQFEELHHPQQIEFARLNLNYTIMSKRKLLKLVQDNYVASWDDPRMPTVSGLRRRGIPAAAIREFCSRIGVAKTEGTVDYALLEYCAREELNRVATRRMVVLDPVKVVITNYPEGETEFFDGENNPEDENSGTRSISFSREIYIEREDFMIDPPRKYFRLAPGKEIRLKHAYYITCTDYKVDSEGRVEEIYCTYDPLSRGGWTDDGRKVKGTSHWVDANSAIPVEVRLYDRLFVAENPGKVTGDFLDDINPDSLSVVTAYAEPAIKDGTAGEFFQFLRVGYFTADYKEFTAGNLVFNKTVGLKDTFKVQR